MSNFMIHSLYLDLLVKLLFSMILLVSLYTCYALIMESYHALMYDPTLGAIGVDLFANVQDVAAVQQDPSFVRE